MRVKQKSTRIHITDLPEVAVDLSENDLRMVSGGLTGLRIVSGGLGAARGCGGRVAMRTSLAERTQYVTDGDWDTD